MLIGLSPSNESFLVALNRISDRAESATRQIATGYRINSASDAPDEISTLLQARVELDRTSQIRTNLGRVKTEVDTAEQTVASAVSLLERVRVLGAQGASSNTSLDARAAAAAEVDGILQQLVSLSATVVDGRYIFSGDADMQPPYSWDPTQPYPVDGYHGAASTRQIEHPSGVAFPIAHTAQEIFDDPSHSVFQAVHSLALALWSNDTNAIEAALAQVTDAGAHLNRQLSFYGSVQNRVNSAVDDAAKMELRLKTEISHLQETDLTEAILQLNQARFHQQAALESRAKLPQTSLFDFLR
jgi:flagellar hook-associated protein 3 FlgL